ncbi:hypothetical protein PR202_ga06080 [Eleusine coracana subsp. coracana]|uniref:NAC domain-containing protein n=1 Tax=Eleusine coracana subsp. coracana TaxID=191504 RepID=A0AAV5BV88_ELECO|nr:hypothetical protein PR202_ga06080 [Eleusine coracana subsp. coracana]
MGSEAAASSSSMEEGASMKTKHELVRQLQFPPGFRFVPTEEELVDVYLRSKIEGRKLPLDVVNEVKLLEWQPGKLVETYKAYGENKWYFFTAREPSSSNKDKEPNRKVKVSGVKATWKATGSLMVICRKGKPGDMVGTKRVLIYHSSDAEEDGKWSMHEYVLTRNSQIGQYALYSIQRKQHSDTEHKTTGRSKRKRETMNVEHGKTTKSKKAAQRQKQGTTSQYSPPHPPLTPPNEDHQTPQQELPPAAYAQSSLPSMPVQQGYPSDGIQQLLGVSAPMSAGHTQACSYDQCGDMAAQFDKQLTFCEQPPNLIWSQSLSSDGNVDAAHQYQQLYQQQENDGSFGVPNQPVYTGRYLRQHVGFFPCDTTQNSSNWELGQDQLYQQGDGNDIGVQEPYAFAQDFQCYQLQGHGAVFGQEAGYGSHGLFTTNFEGDSVGSNGENSGASPSADGFPSDLDILFNDALWVDVPQHKVDGAEEGSDPALQSEQELHRLCGQQQQTENGVGEASNEIQASAALNFSSRSSLLVCWQEGSNNREERQENKTLNFSGAVLGQQARTTTFGASFSSVTVQALAGGELLLHPPSASRSSASSATSRRGRNASMLPPPPIAIHKDNYC